MLTIEYKRGPIKITEMFGNGDRREWKKKKTDIILKLELKQENPGVLVKRLQGNRLQLNIPNFIVDLRQTEEELFKKIHKSTRGDIKKAIERDHLQYVEIEDPNDEQIYEFANMYNDFAKVKRIPFCQIEKLKALRDQGFLIYTYIENENRERLCASMLVMDQGAKQIYGLYGVSNRLKREDKSYIARANKLLQWKEILTAKKRGLDWYNFGGEVTNNKDQGVNQFKKRFGTVTGYDCRTYIPKTLLGQIFVYLLYFKWKKRLLN